MKGVIDNAKNKALFHATQQLALAARSERADRMLSSNHTPWSTWYPLTFHPNQPTPRGVLPGIYQLLVQALGKNTRHQTS